MAPKLSLSDAQKQLNADAKTHPIVPTLDWYGGKDERITRLASLAKEALKHVKEDQGWGLVAGRALIEVGHADQGKSAKKAIEVLEGKDLEVLRWRAHAGAVSAMAGGGKGWDAALQLYLEVLAVAPSDASSIVMSAHCANQLCRKSLKDSPAKMKKTGVPMLEAAVKRLEHQAVKDDPLALRELGLALSLLGKHGEAARALARAVPGLKAQKDLANAVPDAEVALIVARVDSGDLEGAVKGWLAEPSTTGRFELMIELQNAEDWEGLVRVLSLKLDSPLDARSIAVLCRAHLALKQAAAVPSLVEEYEQSESGTVFGPDADLCFVKGKALLALGQRSEAKASLEKALTLDAAHPEAKAALNELS